MFLKRLTAWLSHSYELLSNLCIPSTCLCSALVCRVASCCFTEVCPAKATQPRQRLIGSGFTSVNRAGPLPFTWWCSVPLSPSVSKVCCISYCSRPPACVSSHQTPQRNSLYRGTVLQATGAACSYLCVIWSTFGWVPA